MTDRVMTERYFLSLVKTYESKNSAWRRSWTGKLLASHRLLRERVTELETTIGWYEAKHPND